MRKNVKKRLAAFKVGLVLSIMITPFCFAPKYQALTNVITTNNYGSFERINETFSVGGVVGFSASSVRGNLNGVYNGTVRIYITIGGGLTISNFSVIPENCFIQYYSSSYIDIAFNGVEQWEVTFIGTTYNAHSYIEIDSLTNWNMSYRGQSEEEMFLSLKTTVDGFTQYIDQLEQYTGAINASVIRCENLLTTISQNQGGSSSSTVNNIDVNVDLIADDLNLLKTSNASILSDLLEFLTDGLGNIITMESLISAIDDTTDQLVQVNQNLVYLYNKLDSINTTLTTISTNLQNIDSTIDTISWVTYTVPSTMNYKYNSSDTYQAWDGSSNLSFSTGDIYLQIPSQATRYNRLFRLVFPLYYYNSSANGGYSIDYVELMDNTNNNITCYYTVGTQTQLTIYFAGNTSASASYLYVHLHSSVKTGSLRKTGSWNMYYLPNTDIEYWQLLQFFNQYDYNKRILKAIEALSFSVTNTTVQDTTNNVNNYNSTMNQVHNVENNYTNQFNSYNPIVQTELNTKLNAPNGFIEGTNFIKRLFPRVVDNNSLVGFPYILILAAVVLFVILG